jgi:outer membrane biogenesis lipoprotein LolB
MPYRFILLVSALVLTGCSDTAAEKPRKTRQERAADAQAQLSRTPESRTYRFDGNELRVVEVPVKDSTDFVDIQRCFIWRDQEFKTSTMSCGQQPDILLSN